MSYAYRPTFGPPPSTHRTLADRSPNSASSSFEDALRRLDLGGPGSDNSAPGSGDSSPASSTPRSVTAVGDATESAEMRSAEGGAGFVKDPLDEFRFPASTFTSPSFAHASYAPNGPAPDVNFSASTLKAPNLPSTARFPTPNLSRYVPSASASRSLLAPGRLPAFLHSSPAVSRREDDEPRSTGSAPLSEGLRRGLGGRGPQTLRIVPSPQRDAFEIAAEHSRLRAGVGSQQAWPSTALPTDDSLRHMSVEQLSKLPQEHLARLIDLELARRGQASASPPTGSPSPLWMSAPSFASEPLSAPFGTSSFGSGTRVRSHTSPALAAGRFGSFGHQRSAYDLDVETTAAISSYFEPHAERPPAREDIKSQTTGLGFAPTAAAAAKGHGSAAPYFSGAGLLALPPRTDSRGSSSPASSSAGFSVQVDGRRPSTFASSPVSLHSPALTQPPPSPRYVGAHSPSSKISAQSPEVLARLQAIRLIHPGAFGTHPAPAPASASGAIRQTPPHLDLALQGRGRSTSVGNGGGANPRSPGLAHGISPAVMDPALQQYLVEHGLPLDAPSPTNKKIQLYKTEKCRSWEKNINAATPEERCVYGARCQYAHGEHELRPVERHPKYKTQICTLFWLLGECDFGRRCCFLHEDIPPGGIPELGEYGTQAALRSILMARRSLYTGQPFDQLALALSRVNSAPALQLSFAPGALASPRTEFSTLHNRFESSTYPINGRQTSSLGHRSSHDSLGSGITRSPVARDSSPPLDRPLLRPRDRSDSLSVNMAPVPELTAVPPSLPVRAPPGYLGNAAVASHDWPQYADVSQPSHGADFHTRALATIQAAHRHGAYRSPTSPAPSQATAPPHQSWATYGPSAHTRPAPVGAIGDRGAVGWLDVGQKPLW